MWAIRLGQFYRAIIRLFRRGKNQLSCCNLCLGNENVNALLCQHCKQALPQFNLSNVGGNLLTWPAINKNLPKHQFDRLLAVSPYCWPYNYWIPQLKYNRKVEYSKILADILYAQTNHLISSCDDIAIMAVPLHISTWQQRGFNQSHLLAKPFAQRMGIPYYANEVYRIKQSEKQVGKTGKERRKSLKNAFVVNWHNKRIPKHIILLDDVVTTGTTVNEICRILKACGVQYITVISVCLALAPH